MEEKGPCCEKQHTQSACKLNKINDLRTYCVINMCQNDIQTPQIPFIFDIRKPLIRKVVRIKGFTRVEVAGFEPAAFWSRTPVVSFKFITCCPILLKMFAGV